MLAHSARQASGRGIVLLPAAALVVHQLRYALTYGGQTSDQLATQGHAYLGAVVPWVVMLSAGGLGLFIVRLGTRRVGPRRAFGSLWLGASGGLFAIYVAQETVEGLLATGHPGGLAGVFGHGGWWSVPLSVGVGLALAALLRVADTLVRFAARTSDARRLPALAVTPAGVIPLLGRPLAAAAAGRAPPLSLR